MESRRIHVDKEALKRTSELLGVSWNKDTPPHPPLHSGVHAATSRGKNTNESKTVGGRWETERGIWEHGEGKESKILLLPARISGVVGGYPPGARPV